jgi:hypothetical protein
MDELFASGIKLAYPPGYNYIFENSDETEASRRNHVNCPSYDVCGNWAMYQRNASILVADIVAKEFYASGFFVGKNSEPLVCRLQDGVVFTTGLKMMMFHGDPLMKRVSEIIDRVIEAGLYNHWISLFMDLLKVYSQKISIVCPLDGYYSFNLNHMQPAFYLILMGWGLSFFCFVVELLYNRVLKRKLYL